MFLPSILRTTAAAILLFALYARMDCAQPALENREHNGWQSSSAWLYDALVSRFADQAGDYQTAIQAINGVAEKSQQYSAFKYSYSLAMDALQYARAEKISRAWFDHFSNDDEAELSLIQTLLIQSKQEDAFQQIHHLLDRDSSPQNVAQISQLLSYLGSGEQRIMLLQRLSDHFPKNPYIHYYLGLSAKEQGKIATAILAFDRALALDGDWRQLELLQAETLSSVGKLTEARKMLAKLRTRYPQDTMLFSVEIDLLMEHYQWEEALALAQKWKHIDKNDPNVDPLIATLYVNSGKYKEAQTLYQRLLKNKEIEPDQYILQMAAAADNAGKYDKAEQLLSSIQRDSRLYMLAQQKIALIEFANKSISLAQSRLGWLRKKFPEYALELYLMEVSQLDQLGENDRASTILKNALKDYPDQVDVLYAQAEHESATNQIDAAEKTYQKILALDPANIDALNAYGYLLLTKTDRKVEAEKLIREAILSYSDSPAIQDSYGWLLYLQDKPKEALIWLQRAYSAYRKDEIAAHYIEVLVAAGDLPLAREVYKYERKGQPKNLYIQNVGKLFAQKNSS